MRRGEWLFDKVYKLLACELVRLAPQRFPAEEVRVRGDVAYKSTLALQVRWLCCETTSHHHDSPTLPPTLPRPSASFPATIASPGARAGYTTQAMFAMS